MRLIDADALKEEVEFQQEHMWPEDLSFRIPGMIDNAPAVDAIPVEWLNERHRKCCEDVDTDLMDAITVLCNEYHVWQKEQEGR